MKKLILLSFSIVVTLILTLTSLKSVEQFLLLLFLSRFSFPLVGRFDGIQILLEFALERKKNDQNNENNIFLKEYLWPNNWVDAKWEQNFRK